MPPVNRNPSLTARILAYAGDFSLGQLTFHSLISLAHVRSFYEGLRSLVVIDGVAGDALTSLLAVYVITGLIRFYTTAIFGVSFFQWFIGISNGAEGISGRIAALGRIALEFLLAPTLFVLLPTLNRQPSLIEKISGAYLKRGRGLRGLFGYIARPLVLAFVFLGFFAPLLRNLAVIEGVHVEFSEIPAPKLEATSDFNKFKFYGSNFFGFTTFSDLDANRFILMPQFEVTKEGNQTRVRPFLGVLDSRGQSVGFLKKEATINWRQLAQIARRGNPFFLSSYPFLAGELADESKNTLSSEAYNDLEELVIAALELSFKNVTAHVLKHGPFLGGYVDLRQALLSLLDTGAIPRADTINLGTRKFLRFRQLFDDVPTVEKKYREILLPFDQTLGNILRYEWDASIDSAIARRDFAIAFFSQATWDSNKDLKFSQRDLSALTLIDFLLVKSLTEEQQQKLHDFTYQWFWEHARRGLNENNETLITWMNVTMARVYLVIQERSEFSKLAKMILMLRHSLERRDLTFFDLGKKND